MRFEGPPAEPFRRRRGLGETLLRQRVRLALPVAVVAFAGLAQPTPFALGIAVPLVLLGLAVRAAAAGHLRKHRAFVTSGPYRFTRHPLYFGSLLIGAGFLLGARSLLTAIVAIIYAALFYPASMRREERKLRCRFGSEFDEYAARVPQFWPRLRPAPGSGARFSWRHYLRNREFQAVLGVVAGLLLLWLKMRHGSGPSPSG